MIDAIIAYSIRNKFIIGILVLGLIGWGSYSMTQLPIDAVPDITNNQVQVVTISPNLSAPEVERFITVPVELSLQNLPGITELRSVSRFGFSMITVVFEDKMGIYLPRQLVEQQLKQAAKDIPEGLGTPEMTPISTGLSEIYQYVLHVEKGYENKYSAMDLRTMQDWIVRRQLSGIKGVVEVNSFGGFLKQYEVAINPHRLKAMNVNMNDVMEALENSNENVGGAYIEKDPNAYFIRTEGLVESLSDIENIVIKTVNNVPTLVKDVATVQFGHAPRYGALTRNGEGEVVGGIVMMLKGENAAQVMKRVKARVEQVQSSLPEGVVIDPFLERDKLVNRTINTVKNNLIEGGLIVVFILVLLLGNLRAGLIVASVIPLAMLFAVSMMNIFGVSANLMSLGAIDFGLIVDGAVIIVESIVHRLQLRKVGLPLTRKQMDETVLDAATKIRKSAAFGEIIILIVYLPILTLVGIEGKMFKPMAQTVSFAILGALILSLTYVPMMSALFLSKNISTKRTIADRIIGFFQKIYHPVIQFALRFKVLVVAVTIALFALSLFQFSRLGGEFIPNLEEGDLALHQLLPPGSSLAKSVEVSGKLQTILMDEFPEVEQIVTKIGTAEIPTDLMSIETADIIVTLKPKAEWTSAKSLAELFEKMEAKMNELPGVGYEFQQPIQMRFNELMTGSRADIAIKIYGEDLDVLFNKGKEVERMIGGLEGITSINVEQLTGMPQIIIRYHYNKLAQYGLQVKDVNSIVKTAFAGTAAGQVYEGERRFDLVVRLEEKSRKDLDNVEELFVPLKNGQQVPLREVATVSLEQAPMLISRDNTQRRITIGVNAGNRDTESLVEEIQGILATNLNLPSGYYVTYGGQFQNLKTARSRLFVVVPIALALIFVLLFLTFNSFGQAMLIFTAIPMSLIGGVWGLVLRDMPFSISAGVGFIALFGVAVLNGIVLIGYFNQLKKEGVEDVRERIIQGTMVRLRPVIMTAAVASLGFLPMALSHTAGAEVQRPLATVVIGGLITSTLLTLVVLPILYSWLERFNSSKSIKNAALTVLLIFGFASMQGQSSTINLDQAIEIGIKNHPSLKKADLQIQRQNTLRNTGFELDKTSIYYMGTALGNNSQNLQHDLGAKQTFQLPKVYKAKDEVFEQEYQLAIANKAISEWEIKRQIEHLYYDALAAKVINGAYATYDTLYNDFIKWADLRYQTGETNKAEPEIIRQHHFHFQTKTYELYNEYQLGLKKLEQLLQQENIELADSQLTPLRLDIPSAKATDKHPVLAYILRLEQVHASKSNLEEQKLLPDFSVGYAGQVFAQQSGYFHGVELGINIPLHKAPQRKRIEAAQLGQVIAKSQYEEQQFLLLNRAKELVFQKQQYEVLLETFEKNITDYNTNLLPIIKLNYENGEATYLEYLQVIEGFLDAQLQYWEYLKLYNQIVIELKYLN